MNDETLSASGGGGGNSQGGAGKVPSQIGPYRVVRELGRGGMGMVLEVAHPDVPRRLAMKLLLAGPEDRKALARFQREAQALARIDHPNVVRIHQLGEGPRGPFMVTELVEGANLRALTRDAPLDPHEAARLIRALADALVSLHTAGILHRDLKPENVILRPDGSPVLLDFGLARDQDAERLTRTGDMLGTPAFMSPEQADGRSASSPDERTDVYGLGATLYSLLLGRPPFEGGAVQILRQVLQVDPPSASGEREEVPAELDAIVRVAMAKRIMDRYASMAALRDDLERFLLGQRTHAADRLRLRRRQSASRRTAAGAGALGLLAALGWLGSWVLGGRDRDDVAQHVGSARAPLQAHVEGLADLRGSTVRTSTLRLLGRAEGNRARYEVTVNTRRVARGEAGAVDVEVPLELGANEVVLRVIRAGESVEARAVVTRKRELPPTPPGVRFDPAREVYLNEKDGSELVWVWPPEGEVEIGGRGVMADVGIGEAETAWPLRRVRFEHGYFIGRTEVTWGQFRRFCAETGHPLPPSGVDAPAELPVWDAFWEDAQAYCAWAGLRLPTEPEWEYAARGADGRKYPWGDEPAPGVEHPWTNVEDRTQRPAVRLFGRVLPGGSVPQDRSPFGCMDMAGNVMEWVADSYVLYRTVRETETNAHEPLAGNPTQGVNKGGAWDRGEERAVVYFRSAEELTRARNAAVDQQKARAAGEPWTHVDGGFTNTGFRIALYPSPG